MVHLRLPASFKDIEESVDIVFDVSLGMMYGISHTGLRSQMHHSVEFLSFEKSGDTVLVGDVESDERQLRPEVAHHGFCPYFGSLLVYAQGFESVVFQLGVVICVDIIDAYYSTTVANEFFSNSRAYEARNSRYQHFHGGKFKDFIAYLQSFVICASSCSSI